MRSPVPEAGATRDQEFFWILAADEGGTCLKPIQDKLKPPEQDPHDERARRVVFHVNRNEKNEIPPEKLEFREDADRILHVIRHLYRHGDPQAEISFRQRYVRVFKLSRLVLEEGRFTVAAGRAELESIGKDLIHDEGARVKNKHIAVLVHAALLLSIPFTVGYLAVSYALAHSNGVAYRLLLGLHVDPATLAKYLLLWLGVLLGVCLSYVIRKPKFTLEDLVTATESDLLRPVIRLLFAGAITMLLVMLSGLGAIDLQVGSLKLSDIAAPDGHMVAFLAGALCGISELLLPSMIQSHTSLRTTESSGT